MTNVSVSAIVNGVATVSFDPVTDATGTGAVTLASVGTNGYLDNSFTFDLTIEDNIAPGINTIASQDASVGNEKLIKISGLSDGNTSIEQSLNITATSSDESIIPNNNISINYDQGSAYATLSLTPTGEGLATVTVSVDDGGAVNNTTSVNFDVQVFATYNNTPTLDAEAQVWATETGNKYGRFGKPKAFDDVLAHIRRSRCREGCAAGTADGFQCVPNAHIIGAKIVTPLADAVRLVDGEHRDGRTFECLHEGICAKTLRRNINELEFTTAHGIEHLSLFIPAL